MASKITDLTALTGANAATTDLISIVDVSDTTMAASGTNKSITRAESFKNLPPLSFSTDAFLTRYAAKQVMISGDGVGATTNAGIIAGYFGFSGQSALWSTIATPSTTNHSLWTNGAITSINAPTTNVTIATAGTTRLTQSSVLTDITTPVSISDATDSSSTTTGSLKTAGGLGVAKSLYVGDLLVLKSNSPVAPYLRFGATAGFAHNAGGDNPIGFSSNADVYSWTSSTFRVSSTIALGFASGASGTTVTDSAFSRISAGVIGVGTGAAGSVAGTLSLNKIILSKTITAPGTTGAQTIDKSTGRVNFAAGATSLVVTNSLVDANSIIHVTFASATNAGDLRVVAAAGSFTISVLSPPSAETAVNFTVTN